MQKTAQEKVLYYRPPSKLAEFMLRREAHRHVDHKDPTKLGFHPKNTGIGKKGTSFYEGVCHIRFDRKNLPKSGKRVLKGFFVEDKQTYYLVWDLATRALVDVLKEVSNNKLDELRTKFDKHRSEHGKV